MRIGSLFSGIGGLELGLEWAGLGHVVWQVESDPYCRAVLARHWPEADRSVTDVCAVVPGRLPAVDLLCGGFPCQDVSAAGKQRGIREGTRSGLWLQFRRIVEQLRPRAVVVENVASGAGLWVPLVLADLSERGYRCRAVPLSAGDVGASHERKRVFIAALADADLDGREAVGGDVGALGPEHEHDAPRGPDADRRRRPRARAAAREAVADPVRDAHLLAEQRLAEGRPARAVRDEGDAHPRRRSRSGRGLPQPEVGRAPDGLPGGLVLPPDARAALARWPARDGEPQRPHEPPRVIAERGPYWEEQIRALGNAVVPACAFVVGTLLAGWLREEEVA